MLLLVKIAGQIALIDINVYIDTNHRVPLASRKGRRVFNLLINLMIIARWVV